MAWNPSTGLIYLPTQNNSFFYERAPVQYKPGQWNTGTGRGGAGQVQRPELTGPRTLLKAWDPGRNAEMWRYVSTGGNGGAMSTAGNLVFWGTGHRMVALDAKTGTELWEGEVGNGTGTPVTYSLDGKQYVTIMGGSSPPRVTTFALP